MSAVPHYLVLKTLGKEGEVNVAWDKRSRQYHARFRVAGRQYDRRTGTTDLDQARQRAAEIFAEVVRGPRENHTLATLQNEIKTLTDLVLKLTLNGGANKNPHISSEVKTLGFARDAFLSAKRKEEVSPSTLDRLERRLETFVTFAGAETRLPEITADKIAEWIESRTGLSARAKKNDIDGLAQFWRWARSPPRRWCDPEICRGVARPIVAKHSSLIEVISATTAKSMMAWIEANAPQFALFYAIALFAGARANKKENAKDQRSGEIIRLFDAVKSAGGSWPSRLWNGIVLRLPSGKVHGAPRQVHTPDCLKQWLAAYPNSLEVPHRCWHTKHIAKTFNLPPNGLRHTAASAFISSGGDFGRAAVLFGNSEAMLRKHYVNLLAKEEADAIWQIFPRRRQDCAAA